MSDVDDTPRERTGVSRRTLVRAGAHAAWVVPAVTVISAAPAIAVSAGVHSLTWVTKTASSASGGGGSNSSSTIFTNFTIAAASNPSQVAAITLSITFPLVMGTITLPTPPAGWADVTAANQKSGGKLIAGGTASYSTSVTGTSPTATNTSAWSNVQFTANANGVDGHVQGDTLSVTASASGYTGPGSASVVIS